MTVFALFFYDIHGDAKNRIDMGCRRSYLDEENYEVKELIENL